jgi:23S rRNA (guanosine2251-2'-O)-methyltransferase
MNITVILNNIRSNENVVSIFRTADAAGVSKIILCGYTPMPTDRFGRENKGLTKASLGAEKFVEWEKEESLSEAIKNLKNYFVRSQLLCKSRFQNNFSDLKVIGIEQDKKAIDYKEIKNNKIKNIALVFGNEVDGLSKEDLKLCDIVAQITMHGKKESLNVAVCAGVVLYSLI